MKSSLPCAALPARSGAFLYDQENRPFRTGPCRADVDGDGSVSILDLSKMSDRFTSTEGSAAYDLQLDLDGDGSISILDLSIGSSEFGRSCASTGTNTGEGRSTYNGGGLRIRERTYPPAAPFVTRDFTWDQGSSLPNILQETRTPNGGASATVSYVYGLGQIAATDSAGGTSYFLADGLGSTTQLASTAGAVTDSYTYDVFGGPRSQTGTTANDFRFTGQQADSGANRGLYYLRARSYDPALGRFLQKDRIPFAQPYAYVSDNPTNLIDPLGLCGTTFTFSNAFDCAGVGAEKLHDAIDKAGSYFVNYVGGAEVTGLYWAGWAEFQAGKAILRVIEHCRSDAFECWDRFDMGALGIGLIGAGISAPIAACILPGSVGIVATGGALIALCGVSIPAGASAVFAGSALLWTAVSPWESSTPGHGQ